MAVKGLGSWDLMPGCYQALNLNSDVSRKGVIHQGPKAMSYAGLSTCFGER